MFESFNQQLFYPLGTGCRVDLEVDQATGSNCLLEANWATGSTYLWPYISCLHCAFSMSASSCHPKTNKPLDTSLRFQLYLTLRTQIFQRKSMKNSLTLCAILDTLKIGSAPFQHAIFSFSFSTLLFKMWVKTSCAFNLKLLVLRNKIRDTKRSPSSSSVGNNNPSLQNVLQANMASIAFYVSYSFTSLPLSVTNLLACSLSAIVLRLSFFLSHTQPHSTKHTRSNYLVCFPKSLHLLFNFFLSQPAFLFSNFCLFSLSLFLFWSFSLSLSLSISLSISIYLYLSLFLFIFNSKKKLDNLETNFCFSKKNDRWLASHLMDLWNWTFFAATLRAVSAYFWGLYATSWESSNKNISDAAWKGPLGMK